MSLRVGANETRNVHGSIQKTTVEAQTNITMNFNENMLDDLPTTAPFDLSLAYRNILKSLEELKDAIREQSGARSDDDPVYIFIPPTVEEFEELMRRIREGDEDAIAAFIIPPSWEPVDYVPDGVPQNPPQSPITQEWLDMVRQRLYSIDAGVNNPAPVEVNVEVNVEVPPVDVQVNVDVDLTQINNEVGNMRRAIEETNNNLRQLPAAIGNTMVGSMTFDFDNDRNLTMVFPFSIPFDITRAIGSLRVPPQAPRFEIDFEGTIYDVNVLAAELGLPGGNLPDAFVMVLDMEYFDPVAQVIRWTVWLSFFVGLMYATSKVIKW
jgi:hypothetical protein